MFKALLATLFLAAPPALAQTHEPSSEWALEGTAGIVSDYRYRGYSLSDDGPAFQVGATLTHASGFRADANLSTIDEYGVGDDGDGARLEVTATLGWAGQFAGFELDGSVSAYLYPDGDDVNYVELPVQISKTLGSATGTIGFAYAPAQTALGDEDNRYTWAAMELAPSDWPVSLAASVGYEDGAFAPGGKTDWSLGASRSFGPVNVEVSWVDSDEYNSQIVGAVFVGF